MEDSMALPQKIKNRITVGFSNSTSGIYQKEFKVGT